MDLASWFELFGSVSICLDYRIVHFHWELIQNISVFFLLSTILLLLSLFFVLGGASSSYRHFTGKEVVPGN
jgi:hypothetical protein